VHRRHLLALLPGLLQPTSDEPFDPLAAIADCLDSPDRSTDDATAVVDRIEGGTAVVLFEAEGRQRTVPVTVLPENAREEGIVLRVPDGDALALATVDREATRAREESAQDRFDDLAERPG